ncbi:acriflavin resistance protein [Vibrio astriarenae]|nr:acriflavin resistance protein [Vibrio sp. C7]
MLTYQPEKSYQAYAQFSVRAETREDMFSMLDNFDTQLAEQFSEPTFQVKLMEFGPSPASKIEARITGLIQRYCVM